MNCFNFVVCCIKQRIFRITLTHNAGQFCHAQTNWIKRHTKKALDLDFLEFHIFLNHPQSHLFCLSLMDLTRTDLLEARLIARSGIKASHPTTEKTTTLPRFTRRTCRLFSEIKIYHSRWSMFKKISQKSSFFSRLECIFGPKNFKGRSRDP